MEDLWFDPALVFSWPAACWRPPASAVQTDPV